MNELPPKSLKLLSLALCRSAAEGEWHSAAIKAVAELRKEGIPVAFFQPAPEAATRRQQTTSAGQAMPFGKFKGQLISELPDWYMEWIVANMVLREPLASAINNEIERRVQA